MGIGRFINKNIIKADGFARSDEEAPAVVFEGQNTVFPGPIKAGDSGTAVSLIAKTIYTWNIGAISGQAGSTNSIATQDVEVTNAAIGDAVLVSPIGSMAGYLGIRGFCFSAGNVQLQAVQTGTSAAYTPGNVPVSIVLIKI